MSKLDNARHSSSSHFGFKPSCLNHYVMSVSGNFLQHRYRDTHSPGPLFINPSV